MRASLHVGDRLGSGGFGEVYEARLSTGGGLERTVALKVLRADVPMDGDAARRLRDEARILASMNHSGIVAAHDLCRVEGRLALVMERVPGRDLAALVGRDGMPVRAWLEVVARVASALDAAASLRPHPLIHRDVKPSNIQITPDGSVRLLDFGLARSRGIDREAQTELGMLAGTPGYTAPERIMGEEDDPASDIYSLGCAAAFAALGRPLFADVSRASLVRMASRPEAHATTIREALDAVEDVGARNLLAAMLCHDGVGRPTADRVILRAEALVDARAGVGLRRWCRAQDFATIPLEPGPLSGCSCRLGDAAEPASAPAEPQTRWIRGVHAIDEVVPEPPPTSEVKAPEAIAVPRASQAPATRSPRRFIALGLLAGAVLLALGIGCVAAVVRAGWRASPPNATSAPPPTEEVDPPAVDTDLLAADTDPPMADTDPPVADTDMAEPERPTETVPPKPPAPAHTPTQTPSLATKPRVEVRITGMEVVLVSEDGRVQHSPVAAGAYTLRTFHEGAPRDLGQTHIPAVDAVTIHCNPLLWVCSDPETP